MKQKSIIVILLTLCCVSSEIDCTIMVYRGEADVFHVGKNDCALYGAVKHNDRCRCSNGDTLFDLYSSSPCKSISKECTRVLDKVLVNPGEKVTLRSCHNCKNVIKVSLWNGTEASKTRPWVDVTNEALFNALYDKFSSTLDLSNLDSKKWKGQLIKIEFNGQDNCVTFKMQGLIRYPLPTNIKELLFGNVISTTKQTTEAIKTTTTKKTASAKPTLTIASSKSTRKTLSSTLSSSSAALKHTTTPFATNAVLKCQDNETLPTWVFILFGLLFVVVLILSLVVLWLCKERHKVMKDDRVAICGKTSRINSAFSLHLLTQESTSSTPIDSRRSSPQNFNNHSPAPMSDPGYCDSEYLTPVNTSNGKSDPGNAYAPLSEYPSNVYAESTLVSNRVNCPQFKPDEQKSGDKSGLVYAELEKDKTYATAESSGLGNIEKNNNEVYVELEKEECYFELQKEITSTERTGELLYTALGDFQENIYTA